MPSLFGADSNTGINVAANYGRMVPQQTYNTGLNFTNFGTRNVRLIKVAVSGGTNDMTKSSDGSTGSYTESNSLYSKAVRTLQVYAEIYAAFVPVAGGFVALVSDDTAQDADSGNNANGGWGLAEAAIANSLNASASVTISNVTPTIGTTI
jgi:hypothetical protein